MAPTTSVRRTPEVAPNPGAAPALLEETLRYARERDYTGWDYADGLSSRWLQSLPFDNLWVNLAFQETIKRFPVNVRPLFRVEQRQSFKGSGLFAMANLAAARIHGENRYREEANELLDWLLEHRARGYAGFCGGHQHALQDFRDRKDPGVPGIVSTAYAMLALLEGAELEDRYAEAAHSGAAVIYDDLEYREVPAGARIKYKPDDDESAFTLNANAIAARVLLELDGHAGTTEHRERAEAILDYVVSKQEPIGGWQYMDPPDASHLSMDNHHNGFVVESLQRHRELTGSDRYTDAIERGYEFYRHRLFEPDGAPNWDETQSYPRDIHAAAQGIIVFSRFDDHDFARRVLDWTLANLYAGDGQFYYQVRRWYTKRFTLMRWCQAWMAYALGVYVETQPESDAG